MNMKIKLLTPTAKMPIKAHDDDAAFDCFADSVKLDYEGNLSYGLGFALEIPKGYVGYLYPRSSVCKKTLVMSNGVGIIDAGYRGEVSAKFKPSCVFKKQRVSFYNTEHLVADTPGKISIYEVGDRVAQLIVRPISSVVLEKSDVLSYSERGDGGYGSSGR